MPDTFRVTIKCQTCGTEWEEEAFENEHGETELVDEEGGWICYRCEEDGDDWDTEIVDSERRW